MLNLLLATAYAQEQAAPAGGPQQSPLMSFLPFILIFAVFYFLMIRPQKKKLEEEQSFLRALQKGDEVYTKAGILGTVTGLTEKVITLEVSDGVKLKVLRSQIGGLAKKLFESKKEEKK